MNYSTSKSSDSGNPFNISVKKKDDEKVVEEEKKVVEEKKVEKKEEINVKTTTTTDNNIKKKQEKKSLKSTIMDKIPSYEEIESTYINRLKTLNFTPSTEFEEAYQIQGALCKAASMGNIDEVSRLIDMGADVNVGDYDHRTPMHLSVAEKRIEMCEHLLKHGADINAVDRFGNTCIMDAIMSKHASIEMVKWVVNNGGKVGTSRRDQLIAQTISAAAAGDTHKLELLFAAKVGVNDSDYDKRSPLHLAASEGRVQCVEFLIEHGADVNAVDVFGNTPLQDAIRGRGRNHIATVLVLKENNAILNNKSQYLQSTLQTTIREALPILCERGNWEYGESWIPTSDFREFALASHHSTIEEFKDFEDPGFWTNDEETILGITHDSKTYHVTSKVEDMLGIRGKTAKAAGIKSVMAIPIIFEDVLYATILLYSISSTTQTKAQHDHLSKFSNNMIVSSSIPSELVFDEQPPGLDQKVMKDCFHQIAEQDVFSTVDIYNEVDQFFNMGLRNYYFKRFMGNCLPAHIHSFIASKKSAFTKGDQSKMWLHIENNTKLLGGIGPEQALYMVPANNNSIAAVEKNLERLIRRIPLSKPFSVEYFRSKKPFLPNGKEQMGIFVLTTDEYANPQKIADFEESNIWEVGSAMFLREKSKKVRKRYQELLNEQGGSKSQNLYPVFKVYEEDEDGCVPLMMTLSTRDPVYLRQLTQLCSQHDLPVERKFIETFANGITAFAWYFSPGTDKNKINLMLKQFSLLLLLPQSTLTPYFLNGIFSAAKYSYTSAASRFVYYFINQASEEYASLTKLFRNDPINLGRLRILHTSLRREAVVQSRIWACLTDPSHSHILDELFADFDRRIKSDEKLPPNKKLATAIHKESVSIVDERILLTFHQFNQSILKTNINKTNKAALSFRLDPSLFDKGDWPEHPFGIFFVTAGDFQAFHIRFSDISRGGIRMIKSGDDTTFAKNLQTLYAENYNLAHTQNKKNKDIPEFGSKGAILLLDTENHNPTFAFKKYISGLLDLLVVDDEITDLYKTEELLFLGPDEGTANLMEWAADYARERNYPYWKALTTGKPPSLGGIPHDTYGMTTRSVHEYVLGILEKMNVKEEDITKFQTGGPDGDLGSNEILISKDKTTSIVDGSGVIHDPEGLNRTELERLALERQTIDNFDTAKLGPKGFSVLIGDEDVTLPNGDVVESGLSFRNTFHLNPLSSADLFVPCGGRPESVTLSNFKDLLDAKEKPRFKYIVEGANLFFSQDARRALESRGVIHYKDASSNKGGVTSSSLEVLAALALEDAVHSEEMCVSRGVVPDFYLEYVEEIQERIARDARLEFEAVWREHERTGIYRYLLTDQLSDRINKLTNEIRDMLDKKGGIWDNDKLKEKVLLQAIPKKIVKEVGYASVVKQIPENYLKSLFSSHVASRFVYENGLVESDTKFWEFMNMLQHN